MSNFNDRQYLHGYLQKEANWLSDQLAKLTPEQKSMLVGGGIGAVGGGALGYGLSDNKRALKALIGAAIGGSAGAGAGYAVAKGRNKSKLSEEDQAVLKDLLNYEGRPRLKNIGALSRLNPKDAIRENPAVSTAMLADTMKGRGAGMLEGQELPEGSLIPAGEMSDEDRQALTAAIAQAREAYARTSAKYKGAEQLAAQSIKGTPSKLSLGIPGGFEG